MAHERIRHAQPLLKKLLSFSPVVGVFGHRQVGKTNLVSRNCKEYVTLDLRTHRSRVEADPDTFVESAHAYPLAIDEAQMVPDLFPAIKEAVRLNKKPGRFLLTGSVRFTSRLAIRESLTGRIVHLEILPFTQSELEAHPLNPTTHALLGGHWQKAISQAVRGADIFDMAKYLRHGGLPGVCFVRSEILRGQRLDAQLETILDRDLRLVWDTRLSLTALRGILVNLALAQGEPLELRQLARMTRISVPTLMRALSAFESIFLIRRLGSEGTEKRPVFFLEDQGEATHLAQRPLSSLMDMTRYLFAHIRPPLYLNPTGKHVEIFQYRTRGGAFLPLVVRQGDRVLGLLPMLEENPSRQLLASATSFARAYPGAKIAFVHLGKSVKDISKNMIVLPLSAFA